ncbi:MAG: hypothetical protein K6U74_12370 [Firmicutes bacterium]|nr:hypothetical protein [Bacillota bacterium]
MSAFLWELYKELDMQRRRFWEQVDVCETYEWVERLRMEVWHELKKEWDIPEPPLNFEEESVVERAEKQDWGDTVEEVNGVLHVVINDYLPRVKEVTDPDVRLYWKSRIYRALGNVAVTFDKIICAIVAYIPHPGQWSVHNRTYGYIVDGLRYPLRIDTSYDKMAFVVLGRVDKANPRTEVYVTDDWFKIAEILKTL